MMVIIHFLHQNKNIFQILLEYKLNKLCQTKPKQI